MAGLSYKIKLNSNPISLSLVEIEEKLEFMNRIYFYT